MLHTEPSFCIYNEDGNMEESLIKNEDEKLERSATIGDSIEAQFSFGRNDMKMIKEEDLESEEDDEEGSNRVWSRFRELKIEVEDQSVSRPMYGAAGDGGVDGDGVEFGQSDFEESGDLDKYYEGMIRENPSNAFVLRNYAQYLESKGDLSEAEDYYLRATRADPKDGELLSLYAKLVWQLHHDEETASAYFERAVEAAPDDSNVLAAYASFLWEIDEETEEESPSDTQTDQQTLTVELEEEKRPATPPLHLAVGLGVEPAFGFQGGDNNADSNESSSVEDYHRRMIEENPSNPFFLRDYAQFLHQSKGDLAGAEEYYSRAILANPSDGQILAPYASLLWQLYHDKDRAVSYYEQAVQAAPGDSNVLASYAKFLWETEDEGEDIRDGAHHQTSLPTQEAPTATST